MYIIIMFPGQLSEQEHHPATVWAQEEALRPGDCYCYSQEEAQRIIRVLTVHVEGRPRRLVDKYVMLQ